MDYFYNQIKKQDISFWGGKESPELIYKRETFDILKLKKDNKITFSQWQTGIVGRQQRLPLPRAWDYWQELSSTERRKVCFCQYRRAHQGENIFIHLCTKRGGN